ncbi:MAG: O-antigen ligase family protein [Candidatus Rokubacteria bacterium]|nr:O-antigen ligase family protein [Candidatus Rokubacteria bacterium]
MIHPLWHTGFLALLALAVSLLRLSEPVAAVVVVVFFLAVALLHPVNGVTFLFLFVPFFLGEAYKSPAFLLVPGMVFVVIVLGVWAGLRSGRAWVWPHRGILLFYVASLVLALPLDLKELREDLWVFPPADVMALVLRGIPAVSHLNPLQIFVMALLGVGLYVVVVNLRPPGELIRRTVVAMALVYGGLALLGMVKYFGVIPYSGRYLSLSFAQYVTVGNHPHRLTGIAWNPDYFAQYLVYGAPWMLAFLGRPAWRERVAGFALLPAALALALTFQRGAYLGFLVELGLMALYSVWLHRQAREGRLWGRPWVSASLLALLTLSVLTLDAIALGGTVLARVRAIWELGDANRAHLWRVALAMLGDQPLLGVGTGRFAYFFPDYSSLTPREFGPFWGTAHSLYLQVFAEGGVIGFFALALLIGAIFGDGLRGLRAEHSPSVTLLGAAMISLGGWLFYSVLQSTFYLWSLQIYFWLLAALIMSLAAGASPSPPRAPWHRPLIVGLVACLVLAGAWRVTSIVSRPRALGYEAGFFKWERQPDQALARWTGRRAAAVLPAGGSTLVLTASAPLPGVDHRHQAVTAWLDGSPSASLLLPGREWVQFRLPVNRPQGHPVLLRLQAAYALSPKQVGASSDDRTLGVLMKPPRWE